MPKVSVIIPTYNYGKYIEKAIDSVLAQTYKDFEIIVVDDGSTDNTREIIETRYKDKVRYFYQENKGAPVARNKGIKESMGEYLVFLDADDWLMPMALLSRLEYLKKHFDCGWIIVTIRCVVRDSGRFAENFFNKIMPKENPEVSVIIPTYKRAHLLPRVVKSVLNQTY